jgi:hypothetical protein
MPLTEIRRSNSPLLQHGREAKQLQRVFPNVRVNAEVDRRSRVADRVHRREGHDDVVADAADVDDEPLQLLVPQRPAEMGDHGACRRAS